MGTLKPATKGLLRAMNWATRKLTVVTGGNGSNAVIRYAYEIFACICYSVFFEPTA